MGWFREMGRKLGLMSSVERLDAEVGAEMQVHVELRAEELVEQGVAPGQARRQAKLELGSVVRYRQEAREAWGRQWLDDAVRDMRLSLRYLGLHPGFAISTVLVTALGIGSSTAAFSVLNHVLLKPPPYQDPARQR